MSRTFHDESVDLPEGLLTLFQRSRVSLTLADLEQPDCPLIAANDHFFELCGYRADEVIGQNCRFLQPACGAGPVRDRMRQFITDEALDDGKFVVPNETKGGKPFLNLIYMSKLKRGGKPRLILGSQFRINSERAGMAELYDRALTEDLRKLNLLTTESNWIVLGSFEALASSNAIIAQARFE